MNILVTKDYRLVSDEYCIIVEHRRVNKKNGQEYWTPETYHRTVEQAMEWLLQKKIRESEATSLKELKNEISEIKQLLAEALI